MGWQQEIEAIGDLGFRAVDRASVGFGPWAGREAREETKWQRPKQSVEKNLLMISDCLGGFGAGVSVEFLSPVALPRYFNVELSSAILSVNPSLTRDRPLPSELSSPTQK